MHCNESKDIAKFIVHQRQRKHFKKQQRLCLFVAQVTNTFNRYHDHSHSDFVAV